MVEWMEAQWVVAMVESSVDEMEIHLVVNLVDKLALLLVDATGDNWVALMAVLLDMKKVVVLAALKAGELVAPMVEM